MHSALVMDARAAVLEIVAERDRRIALTSTFDRMRVYDSLNFGMCPGRCIDERPHHLATSADLPIAHPVAAISAQQRQRPLELVAVERGSELLGDPPQRYRKTDRC